MSSGGESSILVCSCGRKLRAPNARPGRMGRCPSCGATLQAPGIEPKVVAESPRSRTRKADREDCSRIPAEPVVVKERIPPTAGEDVLPERIGTSPRKKRKKTSPIGREAVVRPPKSSSPGLFSNVLYPLWDANGLTILAILPIVLAITSLLSVGLVRHYFLGGEEVVQMGSLTMILPMTLFMLLTLGYFFTFLSDVILHGGEGDVYHPKVPPWAIGFTVASLWRWMGSLAVAMVMTSPVWYPIRRGLPPVSEFGPKQWLIAGFLFVPAMAYAPMALVSTLLHGTLLAANPLTVLCAMKKSGFRVIGLTLLMAGSWVAGVTAVFGLFVLSELGGIPAAIVGAWVFWVGFVYVTIVLARVLGLFYYTHAKAIGWFPERARWGAS